MPWKSTHWPRKPTAPAAKTLLAFGGYDVVIQAGEEDGKVANDLVYEELNHLGSIFKAKQNEKVLKKEVEQYQYRRFGSISSHDGHLMSKKKEQPCTSLEP
jgi:hypothetical protein